MGGVILGIAPLAAARSEPMVVAVYASTSPAYHRERGADGNFRPETYAFGNGGFSPGNVIDPSIDPLSFTDVARRIAPALAAEEYLPCDPKKPKEANLLIMVYWGVTRGTDDTSKGVPYEVASSILPPPMAPPSPTPDGNLANGMTSDPTTSGRSQEMQMRAAQAQANDSLLEQSIALTHLANVERDREDAQNASILGYLPDLREMTGMEGTALEQRRRDMLADVEESRYYVVLLAYDFQELLRNKQRKLLWETRYSLPVRRTAFDKALARMSRNAARYFGQDSRGHIRDTMPDTNVTVGPLREVGDDGQPKK